MTRPVVSLLTDFGVRDSSAGDLPGVVLGIAPDAEVIDITHEVRKYAIRDGALAAVVRAAVPAGRVPRRRRRPGRRDGAAADGDPGRAAATS